MFKNNPMLKMWEYERQSSEARKNIIQRMSYPMIGLGISYAMINPSSMSASAMNGKDMLMPMVTVTLPIYRKKYRAMQAETELMRQSVIQGYQDSYNELQSTWIQALQMYRDAQRRTNVYASQCLLLQKTLDILLQNFAATGVGLTEILLTRQQTLDYEFKKAEATADLLTAIAWIKKLSASFDVE
ncbi:MAG: TolC family protein [Bacteroidales bacterium]